MSRGKSFENELRKAFLVKYPGAYVERNPDRLTGRWGTDGRAISLPSPPDLIVNGARDSNYLIECKAQQGVSIPFARGKDKVTGELRPTLSDHQHDYLMDYDKISDHHFGYVAVNFYEKRSYKKAWLIPISYWSNYQARYPRKSLAMKHLESDIPDMEMLWGGNGIWILPEIV